MRNLDVCTNGLDVFSNGTATNLSFVGLRCESDVELIMVSLFRDLDLFFDFSMIEH